MTDWELDGLRRRLDAGEVIDLDEQRRLVHTAAELLRAARLPAEFVFRAHRPEGSSGWTVEHPLLRWHRRSDHPGDAFVLAGAELRRVLADSDPPDGDDTAGDADPADEDDIDEIAETVWETLTRSDPGPDTVAALRGALAALDAAREEIIGLRHQDALRVLAGSEPSTVAEVAGARAELRRQHRERLAGMGVEGADVSWRSDAFGPATEYGLTLPTLVTGFTVRTEWPDSAFWPEALPPESRWVALDHHWRNDDAWSRDPKSLVLVATALTVDDLVELSLRRLTGDTEEGDTIAAHCAYAAAVERHLPDVAVGAVRGWVGHHALPFPVAAIETLTGAPADNLAGVAEGVWWLNAEPS